MPAPVHEELPDDFLAKIATVVVRWNLLEGYLNLFLTHLLGFVVDDVRGYIIFAHMTFPHRLEILESLADAVAKNPKYSHLTQCEKIVIPLLKEAQRKRNQIIHSTWGVRNGEVLRMSVSARRVYKFIGPVVKTKELDDDIASIQKAIDTIYDLASPVWQEEYRQSKLHRKQGKSGTLETQ